VVTHINLFVTAACSSSPWWQESYRILLGTKLIGALFGRLLQVFAVCYSVLLSGGPCSGLNKVAKTHGALFSTNEPHTTHHFPQNRSRIHIILCRRALWSVKKTTSRNLWPRTARSAVFFFRCQPRNLENVTLIVRRREHFRGFLAIFLVAQLPPKKAVLVHKNSLASCQRCRHSIEPRALTCPFKQSNLSAWSCPNL